MKLKTYQSWTMAEALAFVKTDLGADAVILHTRTFERGGFFGFGRRSVVEITAARAQDMPRVEPRAKRSLAASSIASSIASSTASSAASSASADRTADPLRISAAARAYGAQSAAHVPHAHVPPSAAARSADAPVSMEVDREKTRRLAQAMSISLEKQAAARAIASRNEDAVREAAAAIDARMAAAAKPDNQPIDGPAQRFVLMPDAANGGAQRLTAAVLRTPDSSRAPETSGVPEFSRLASQSASQSASAPVVQASSVAASISPTHSSVDAVSAFVEAKPAARESELDAISEFVGRVLKRGGAEGQTVASAAATATASSPAPSAATSAGTSPAIPSRPRSIEAAHAHLLEQELDSDLAARIINDVAKQFAGASASAGASSQPSDADVRHALEQRLVAILPSDDEDPFAMAPGANGARRIAFVGPTGVGKTTTLAKIAAQLKLKRGLRVGIVAADTYRIAAVDQLRTYAEILGLPVEVASSPKDAARACASLSDVDVILIDTAGRSQNDHMKISELRAFLASAAPDETHLVLSATASARTLARAAETFGAVGVNRIVLTKLDEAATFGTLVSLVERLGKRVSFFTQGQEVPDHIEIARSRRLAALILGSEVR